MAASNGQLEELVEQKADATKLRGFLTNIVKTMWAVSDIIPPWWSRARDTALDQLITEYDHLGGLVYTTSTKLVNIPLKFVPKKPQVSAHADLAETFTEQVKLMSGYGNGFRHEYKLGVYDLLCSDNGMHFGVMGPDLYDWDKPLQSMPLGIRHLDSQNVQRTGNPLHPIIYTDPEFGGRWAYHYTRVISLSQLPSPRKHMMGVGRCALGRSVRVGQILQDQLTYKSEQMGTRPTNRIIGLKGGAAEDIIKALLMSEELMDSLGLTRYAMDIAMGLPIDGDILVRKLNDFGLFDEETGTTMAMYALAYIWGMDIRDFWPMTGSKQGNETTNMVARGRLPSEFTQDLADILTLKLCPAVLRAEYDFQDDEEDQARAVSQDIRARRRERNAKSGVLDKEAERRLMVIDGDLSREEFIRMQLDEGKLEDGTPIATLFYSSDPLLSELLAIPNIANPLLYSQNDSETILSAIEERKADCYLVLAAGGRKNTEKGTQALAALNWLESQYDKPEPPPVNVSTLQDVEDALIERTPDEEE